MDMLLFSSCMRGQRTQAVEELMRTTPFLARRETTATRQATDIAGASVSKRLQHPIPIRLSNFDKGTKRTITVDQQSMPDQKEWILSVCTNSARVCLSSAGRRFTTKGMWRSRRKASRRFSDQSDTTGPRSLSTGTEFHQNRCSVWHARKGYRRFDQRREIGSQLP